MRLELGDGIAVRELAATDAEALLRYAGSHAVARHLRDRFPHPYTAADAAAWLRRAAAQHPTTAFAIASPEELIGGIGLELGDDVYRLSAEIGYWLGEPFWGRGIATRAVRAFTDWAFEAFDLRRIYGGVFDANPASVRVLEKAGYLFEGRMRSAVVKDGRTLDELIYARLRGA